MTAQIRHILEEKNSKFIRETENKVCEIERSTVHILQYYTKKDKRQ